jgi:UDP-N-acetylglucosamine--N-acetylmuramyl-(pentapeptide) pyrophosphoryl-undecaprenol N-acetylglucosamine transferase
VRLIVTGGGTGGHVFPALEIARLAMAKGAEVLYFGSYRGQEMAVCEKEGILFRAFRSEPFYGLKSIRGLKSGWNLFWAGQRAKAALKHVDPDAVFSTGGYSSAPVVTAARSIGIPYIVMEQNSVPGRVNKMVGPEAHAVATVFHATTPYFEDSRVVRTGMPIRAELRAAANQKKTGGKPQVLVMGGSQGAAALNDAVIDVAKVLGKKVRWVHLTGKEHFEKVAAQANTELAYLEYEVKAFMDGPELAEAMAQTTVAVCRCGAGTLSELAAFRIPGVLVPYPAAHANHQFHNAKEFEEMGAAKLIPQESLNSKELGEAIDGWLSTESRRGEAAEALATWDRPTAGDDLLDLLDEAAKA